MKRIARSAIVPHSAAQLYALVEDVERYPQFLPWCAASEILERGADATRARLTIGVGGVNQSFTTQNANRPGEAIDMRLVEGPFRRFAAAWRFQPLGAQACKVEFSNAVVDRVVRAVFDEIANSLVDAFARRANQRFKDA